MKYEFTTVTVASQSEYYGPHHLSGKLAEGWEIMHIIEGMTVRVQGRTSSTLDMVDVIGSVVVLRRQTT